MPRNIISTWLLLANKEEIIAAFSSGTINLKSEDVKVGKHDDLDKAVCKWLMSAGSNIIFVSALVLQEKASDIAKKIDLDNFKALSGWVTDVRHGLMSHLRQCQVKQNHAHQR